MNAILLPNGKVLAEGGSVNNESPDTPAKTADVYDPVSNSMSSAGTAAFSRLYHSTALLLPDATVVSMGSNPGARGSYEPAIEIYTPPYLYDPSDHLITTKRPQITSQPFTTPLAYNTVFQVGYASSAPIASAVLVRPGSVTHAACDSIVQGIRQPIPKSDCGDVSTGAVWRRPATTLSTGPL